MSTMTRRQCRQNDVIYGYYIIYCGECVLFFKLFNSSLCHSYKTSIKKQGIFLFSIYSDINCKNGSVFQKFNNFNKILNDLCSSVVTSVDVISNQSYPFVLNEVIHVNEPV